MMDRHGKSDRPIVPRKPPNRLGNWPRRWQREGGEPRGIRTSTPCLSDNSAGPGRPQALERIRQAVRRDHVYPWLGHGVITQGGSRMQ